MESPWDTIAKVAAVLVVLTIGFLLAPAPVALFDLGQIDDLTDLSLGRFAGLMVIRHGCNPALGFR